VGEKMSKVENVYIKNINKKVVLNVEVDQDGNFDNAVVETIVEVELAINDKTVKFEESDKIFSPISKTIEEINNELNEKINETLQYTKEKALKLENIINFLNGYCKANGINFEIAIV
jgi:SMC interacting uncharacterized protein involved in chromosome segregation